MFPLPEWLAALIVFVVAVCAGSLVKHWPEWLPALAVCLVFATVGFFVERWFFH